MCIKSSACLSLAVTSIIRDFMFGNRRISRDATRCRLNTTLVCYRGVGRSNYPAFVTPARSSAVKERLRTSLKNRENCPRNSKSKRLGRTSTSGAKEWRSEALPCEGKAEFRGPFFPPFLLLFARAYPEWPDYGDGPQDHGVNLP